MRLRGEKPHQGVRSSNPAPYRVRNRCNLRSALGLRAGCVGNRVRSFCSGEQYDTNLNLYYLRARYYNPATGRFMSRDPNAGKLKDPKSLHKYLYADGNPVDGMDPSGRDDEIEYRNLVCGGSGDCVSGITKLHLMRVVVWSIIASQLAEILDFAINPETPAPPVHNPEGPEPGCSTCEAPEQGPPISGPPVAGAP